MPERDAAQPWTGRGYRATEAERTDILARELGVPSDDPAKPSAVGVAGLDGRVYSWTALVLAHVRLLKSLQDREPGASDR